MLSSLFIWVAQGLYSHLIKDYQHWIARSDIIIITIFSLEFIARILFSARRAKYLFSFNGIVDFLSIAPALLEIFLGSGFNVAWFRIFKLARLVRLLKITSFANKLNGIIGETLPYVTMALLLKCAILVLEQNAWWNVDSSINILIGVSGFSIAILLGSKLSAVNGRLYALEDAICKIVGAMRDMWFVKGVQSDLAKWGNDLEAFLKLPYDQKIIAADKIRAETDRLEALLEEIGIKGPNSAGFHRDIAFLIHRATTKTPPAYDAFLKYATLTYCLILIVTIPGLVGLISTGITSFVIGGIYFLIADMDSPLNYDENSFITARLDALHFWNRSRDIALK